MFRNVKLTQKLTGLFLVFGIVPMAVIGFIAFQEAKGIESRTASRFQSVAENIADKIDRNLFERYGDVQAFGFNRALFRRDDWHKVGEQNSEIVRVMNQYVDTYDLYYLTILVDTKGKVIAVNTKDQDGKDVNTAALYQKNYSQSPWFVACASKSFTTKMPFTAPGNDVSNGTFIEDVHVDADVKAAYSGDNGLTLGFSAPVYENGKVIAYWSNRAKFSVVESIIKTAYAEQKAAGFPETELTLLDSAGRILVDYDPTRTGKEEVVHDFDVLMKLNLAEKGVNAAKLAVAGKSGYGWAMHARKKIMQAAGYTHLRGAMGYPGMNWAVLARAPRSDVAAAAGITAIKRNVVMTGVVSLVVILILGAWIGRSLSQPIVKMSRAATQIAVGDINQTIDHQSGDEIGVLAQAFRGLVDYIKGIANAADALSKGDVSVRVVAKSERDVLSQSVSRAVASLSGLVDETNGLIQSAQEGKLNERGNAARFEGAYRELVQGINGTLDAMVAPINEANDVLQKVADRDLNARMTGNYKGDFARIKDALNTAAQNLDTALSQVAVGAEQVASTSSEISAGSQTLSQGASEQASSLEEVSSSLQEMASMTKQNAANAREAQSLSEGARQSAAKGVDSMKRLSEAVDRIKASSDATAKIVKTIDEIAFQTNLLALNAAVEAARAGDAGKGFAVVAEEVRNLAMRSAEAAKNTANMIEESVKNAEGGVALNQEVLENLNEINGQVNKVREVMAEIAAASEQQSQGITQVNVAVEQMNQVTQQVAANAEESAAAAEELNSQSAEMRSLVGQFRLSGDRSASVGAGVSSTSHRATSVSPMSPQRRKFDKTLARAAQTAGHDGGHAAPVAAASQVIPFEEDEQDVLREF